MKGISLGSLTGAALQRPALPLWAAVLQASPAAAKALPPPLLLLRYPPPLISPSPLHRRPPLRPPRSCQTPSRCRPRHRRRQQDWSRQARLYRGRRNICSRSFSFLSPAAFCVTEMIINERARAKSALCTASREVSGEFGGFYGGGVEVQEASAGCRGVNVCLLLRGAFHDQAPPEKPYYWRALVSAVYEHRPT